MTRIIAGTAGGRRLLVPSGISTRPTSDRAREGLFSSLQSLTDLPGANVLDLYAGSGALGLEALSRGAAQATLVEDDPRALAAIRSNVDALGLAAAVVDADVNHFLGREPTPYDVVVMDPPYDVEVDPVLAALLPWVAEDGVVVVERRTRGAAPTVPAGLREERSRRYGEATLWYFARS
ncbi:MAG: putative methylase [Frankiales bacterium]|nr:putative methylase [Frankiales bacterium]